MSSQAQNSGSGQSNQDPHQYSPQILFELFRKSAEEFKAESQKRKEEFDRQTQEYNERAKKADEERAELRKEMKALGEYVGSVVTNVEGIKKSTGKEVEEMKERAKKADEERAELRKEMKALGEYVGSVVTNVEGIKKSTGKEVEDFFSSSLERKQRLGTVQFDVAERNMKRRTPEGESIEIDFFLENGSSVGIVEIKNKVEKKHLQQLEKIMTKLKKMYPFYKNYKVLGAIAGKIITPDIENLALKKGFFVLRQQGDHIETIPPQNLEI